MWTIEYILSQISVIIASILLSFTFFIKNKKAILVLVSVSTIFFALEYLLLGAYIAVGVNLLSLARTIWFYINDTRGKAKDYTSLIIPSIAFIVVSIFTYTAPIDILIMIASLLFSYSVWQTNILFYRASSAICSIFWIIYNVYCMTIVGIALEVVMLIVKSVGTIMYIYSRKHLAPTTKTQIKEG